MTTSDEREAQRQSANEREIERRHLLEVAIEDIAIALFPGDDLVATDRQVAVARLAKQVIDDLHDIAKSLDVIAGT
jgi:hypothetical protein